MRVRWKESFEWVQSNCAEHFTQGLKPASFGALPQEHLTKSTLEHPDAASLVDIGSWMRLPAGQPACGFGAVNRVDLAGYVRCIVRRQKGKQGRDLFRLGVPPQRNLSIHFVEHRISVFGALHWGQHVTWRDGAHPYRRREFQRHRSS